MKRRRRALNAGIEPDRPLPRDLPGLTSLRALAALLVFGYHIEPVVPMRIFAGGYAGVAFFFVLSGFVLTWGAGVRAGSRFYLRRLARIFPSHLIVWAAVLLLPITSGPKDPFHAAMNLTLLQAWSWRLPDVFSVNGVTWSLSCEMFFYLLFPFVYAATQRLRLQAQWAWVAGLYAIAGTVVVVGSFADESGALALIAGANPLVRAPEFLLGVVGARTVQARVRIPVWTVLPVLGFAIGGLAFAHGSPAGATWAAPLFLLVILFVAQATVDGNRTLDWRWALYAGKVSFCFYLVHQLTVNQTFVVLGEGVPQAVLALAVSCGLAVALHHTVEIPAHRMILQRAGARRLAVAP